MADQTKKIIYLQDNGSIALMTPGVKEERTVDEIARKDVPTGKPYKIIEATDIDSLDMDFFNAWTIDEAELTDGVGD